MGTTRARLMPERRSLRFIVRPGAVEHQNGADVRTVVQELHIFVAQGGESTHLACFVCRDDGLAQPPHFNEFLAHFAVTLTVEQQQPQ